MQLTRRSSTPVLGAVSRLIAGLTVWVATFVLLPSLAFAAEPQRNVHYSYDLMGRQLTAKFDSPGGTDGITNTYNGFGDLITSQLRMGTFNKTLTSIYDGAGRRTRLTHPDNQAFTYAYDDLSRLSGVYQGTGTTTSLATFSYASNGLVSARSEGSGNSGASYGWDDINRLTSQSDTFRFNVNNVAWGFTYNPASQIVTETRDNDAYAQAVAQGSTAYAVNGLNQYTNVGGTAHTYDANGNLTDDGTTTYAYDVENRLVRATAGSTVTNLVYDPLGRLFQVDRGTSGTTTRFLHDGDALALELSSSNAVTNRFVHGSSAAADDPLVWYSGSGLTNKRWLHADHLGSIVAWTNSTGGSPTINTYDEYGVPAATNSGRFQYTGQAWISELALYYYKARFYDPRLGRFLQVDPVGYEGGINLYAYVIDDPINFVDPTGNDCGSRIPGVNAAGCFDIIPGVESERKQSVQLNLQASLTIESGSPSELACANDEGLCADLVSDLFNQAGIIRGNISEHDAATASWWNAYALIDPGYNALESNLESVLSGLRVADRASVPATQYGLIGGRYDFYQRYTVYGIPQRASMVLDNPRVFYSPTTKALYFAPYHHRAGPGVSSGFILLKVFRE